MALIMKYLTETVKAVINDTFAASHSYLNPLVERLGTMLSRLSAGARDQFWQTKKRKLPSKNHQTSASKLSINKDLTEEEKDHYFMLRNGFTNFYSSGNSLCDITLLVDGHAFPCHRIVLASASEYFHRLFLSQFNESQKTVIEIAYVTSTAMNCVLR